MDFHTLRKEADPTSASHWYKARPRRRQESREHGRGRGKVRFADNPGAIARRPTFAAWIRLRQGARNHQGDVILLFATAAELLHRLNNCLEKWSHGKVKIAT